MNRVLIFIILVFLLGCSNNYIFCDYFPLREGNQWIYTDNESEFFSYVEEHDSCFFFVLGERSYCLRKDHSGIYNRIELVKTYNGEKIVFGSYEDLYLPNPLIDGDEYLNEESFEKIVSGDTVYFKFKNRLNVKFIGKFKGLKDYNSCYLVERTLIYDRDTLITKEYYTPEIGLIRLEKNGKNWNLKEWFLY